MPPKQEEIKAWSAVYLSYFNSDFSVKQGRKLPKYLCVQNPRPDEIINALKSLGIKYVFEPVSINIQFLDSF